jgi:hypothetical protein
MYATSEWAEGRGNSSFRAKRGIPLLQNRKVREIPHFADCVRNGVPEVLERIKTSAGSAHYQSVQGDYLWLQRIEFDL